MGLRRYEVKVQCFMKIMPCLHQNTSSGTPGLLEYLLAFFVIKELG
jgi:hypothetical protein